MRFESSDVGFNVLQGQTYDIHMTYICGRFKIQVYTVYIIHPNSLLIHICDPLSHYTEIIDIIVLPTQTMPCYFREIPQIFLYISIV